MFQFTALEKSIRYTKQRYFTHRKKCKEIIVPVWHPQVQEKFKQFSHQGKFKKIYPIHSKINQIFVDFSVSLSKFTTQAFSLKRRHSWQASNTYIHEPAKRQVKLFICGGSNKGN